MIGTEVRREGDRPGERLGKRCRELGPWLSSYLDGELEGVAQTPFRCRIEEHLECCPSCATDAAQWLQDAALLEVKESELPVAPWFQQRFSARLVELEAGGGSREPGASRLTGLRWILWRALPVAVVVLGLGLGVLLRTLLMPTSVDSGFLVGLGLLESSTLASSGAFAGDKLNGSSRRGTGLAGDSLDGDKSGGTVDFEEILRLGTGRSARASKSAPKDLQSVSAATSADLTGAGRYQAGLYPTHQPPDTEWKGRPEKDR